MYRNHATTQQIAIASGADRRSRPSIASQSRVTDRQNQTRPRSRSSIKSPTKERARSAEPTSDNSVSATSALRTRTSPQDEPLHQPLIGALRAGDSVHTTGGDGEIALGASAAFGRRIAVLR